MSRGAPSSSGALALTRPSLVPVRYMTCIARVHALVALGDEVLARLRLRPTKHVVPARGFTKPSRFAPVAASYLSSGNPLGKFGSTEMQTG